MVLQEYRRKRDFKKTPEPLPSVIKSFIPSTIGEDGDPFDVLVLMDAPAHVGCLIEIRITGIITAEQTEDGRIQSNDRLLGVAVHSYDHENLDSINHVSKTPLDQL